MGAAGQVLLVYADAVSLLSDARLGSALCPLGAVSFGADGARRAAGLVSQGVGGDHMEHRQRLRAALRAGGAALGACGYEVQPPYGTVMSSMAWPAGSMKYTPRPPSLWLIVPGCLRWGSA